MTTHIRVSSNGNEHVSELPEEELSRNTMTTRIQVSSSRETDDLTEEEERLFTVITFNKIHKIPALLSHIRSLEIRNQRCCTLLLHSVQLARKEHITYLVRLFVRKGSDVNAQDDAGKTSLMHLILRGGPVDALRPLMRCRRLNPDMQDKEGNTALMYAAREGNTEALNILLFLHSAPRHANVHVRNHAGLSALDFAVQGQQVLCCQILVEEAKADTNSIKDPELFHTLYHIGV